MFISIHINQIVLLLIYFLHSNAIKCLGNQSQVSGMENVYVLCFLLATAGVRALDSNATGDDGLDYTGGSMSFKFIDTSSSTLYKVSGSWKCH